MRSSLLDLTQVRRNTRARRPEVRPSCGPGRTKAPGDAKGYERNRHVTQNLVGSIASLREEPVEHERNRERPMERSHKRIPENDMLSHAQPVSVFTALPVTGSK